MGPSVERRRVKPLVREVSRVKVIVFGDAYVGKTSVISRYCTGQFSPTYNATVGIDFQVSSMTHFADMDLRLNLWDLSGHEEFLDVRNEFYKDAHGGILMYDITSRKSFTNLDLWLREALKCGGKDVVYVVCGNKSDMRSRAVGELEGRQWASSKGFLFFETSASTGRGIHEMFAELTRQLVAAEG
ncbi:unnamed protein product [Vitrella brassicaformis CCMP3155]|uniref:Uncharacterized protein n=1 Tax=Vitrella brassicaformis (strain CCMP3155) TaxID=1169540 RepID=A0A0G4EYA7_VITBC|nr:unnamed protein product [Vitrella brassicaformis CCMP3155]|eukprot:CEM03619.1 unnamed protein product [Vitrella brassicaformis CCMP3155]